jgi:ubiquinone/menaquinone biosynthesis C-methylase UbiE
MTQLMTDTGERMIPEKTMSNVFWEHVFRYAFACKKVKNLTVLDIASGEGYGSHALSKVAERVVGVDISPEAVEYAKAKYGIDYRVGSADSIPLESASVDAVVSFETIEHVPDPVSFVNEVFRVLKPKGLFIVSTPNKDVYHHDETPNPFHCSEMTKVELFDLLNPCFQVDNLFGQAYVDGTGLDKFQRFVGRFSNTLAFKLRLTIQQSFLKRFAPPLDSADVVSRQRIIDSIPHLSTPFNWLWNPYSIRKFNNVFENQPRYFLAVATKRDARN